MTPRRGLIWPLILITIGVIFLLANFGYLAPISVIGLLSMWPLILIIVGIDIAIGRRWPLYALIADVAVLAAGVALVAASSFAPGFVPFVAFGSSEPGVTSIDVPRSDVKTMSLRLSAGAGSYDVRGGSSSLVHADSNNEDLRLRTATRSGDRMDVSVDQGPAKNFFIGPAIHSRVTMTVASDVPTALRVDAGAGEFTIDTSSIQVTSANISVGAASLRLVLPEHPTGDVSVTVSAGASSIVIQIPSSVEARVTTSGGLTSTRFESSRFSGSETSGYSGATNRVTVRISAGATSIRVVD